MNSGILQLLRSGIGWQKNCSFFPLRLVWIVLPSAGTNRGFAVHELHRWAHVFLASGLVPPMREGRLDLRLWTFECSCRNIHGNREMVTRFMSSKIITTAGATAGSSCRYSWSSDVKVGCPANHIRCFHYMVLFFYSQGHLVWIRFLFGIFDVGSALVCFINVALPSISPFGLIRWYPIFLLYNSRMRGSFLWLKFVLVSAVGAFCFHPFFSGYRREIIDIRSSDVRNFACCCMSARSLDMCKGNGRISPEKSKTLQFHFIANNPLWRPRVNLWWTVGVEEDQCEPEESD
jgi:hypothetical protein